jgi:death on curing protein
MSIRHLTVDEVLFFHQSALTEFGGEAGLLSREALESAVGRPQASSGGEDAYSTIFSKAASLLHSLVLNHAFLDGNKRVAYVASVAFLHMNGFVIEASQDSKYQMVMDVIEKGMDLGELASWLEKHARPITDLKPNEQPPPPAAR